MIGNRANSTKDSNAVPYRLVWQGDPALRPMELPADLPQDAGPSEREEWQTKVDAALEARGNELRVARETQDYSPLLVEDKAPTYFVMRWLPYATRQRWNDELRKNGGSMGPDEGLLTLFLLALVDVENFGGKKFGRLVKSDRFGDTMAPGAFCDELERLVGRKAMKNLVGALAWEVYQQEEHTGPL